MMWGSVLRCDSCLTPIIGYAPRYGSIVIDGVFCSASCRVAAERLAGAIKQFVDTAMHALHSPFPVIKSRAKLTGKNTFEGALLLPEFDYSLITCPRCHFQYEWYPGAKCLGCGTVTVNPEKYLV